MRRNVTFVITLLVIALAAVSLTKLADAQSTFLPEVSSGEEQAAEVTQPSSSGGGSPAVLPTPQPFPTRRPVETTDLVPELSEVEKTKIVFGADDGSHFAFMVANYDNDQIEELAKQYGPIQAILLPQDRDPSLVAPTPTGIPAYEPDPNFVHPEVKMPPVPPTPMPPIEEFHNTIVE